MLPLEQSKSLVDQRQNIDAHGVALLLLLNGLFELLNSFGVVLLVEQKLTIVVVYIGNVLKVLHRSAERGHGGGNGAHLVLSDAKLDVREDEGTVKINGLLVILGSLSELLQDEVQLSTVVVDVRVVLVVGDGELEVISGSILVS